MKTHQPPLVAAGIAAASSVFGICLALLVAAGFISGEYVWGGRAESQADLLTLEVITLVVNAGILWLITMSIGKAAPRISQKSRQISFSVLVALMALNTLGNLAAETVVEQWFAFLTAASAICFFILARHERS